MVLAGRKRGNVRLLTNILATLFVYSQGKLHTNVIPCVICRWHGINGAELGRKQTDAGSIARFRTSSGIYYRTSTVSWFDT